MSSTAATKLAAATVTNDSVTIPADAAVAYEDEHVHSVYQHIAPHFSSTRYKPWPIVERFLQRLATGSVGLDVGCGNGKYLSVNRNVFIVASDRSLNLVRIAATAHDATTPHAVCVADTLYLPHPHHSFDFAICIAVVHHLSTPERRVAGIAALLETLRRPQASSNHASTTSTSMPLTEPTPEHFKTESRTNEAGKVLIFVWALEQKGSRRGWDAGGAQDVMVPWVMHPPPSNSTHTSNQQGRIKQSGRKASHPGKVNETTEVKASKHSSTEAQDTREETEVTAEDIGKVVEERQVHNRYYHLYRAGELEEDIHAAGGVVLESGYEKDNWWAVASPLVEFGGSADLGGEGGGGA